MITADFTWESIQDALWSTAMRSFGRCPTCNGEGRVAQADADGSLGLRLRTCPECRGTGRTPVRR